jgi:hypothetical protein
LEFDFACGILMKFDDDDDGGGGGLMMQVVG